ncbi:transposase-like protein [Brucella pseudogrignonensis]|uniref:Transposase-like protein n=1 Tax=Brucella pseudogrignonensis TaxID=419475 RepID=A0ABU1MEN6_9HYPH|nr:transposase-like protein [Brucella pseudogrignonensis]
MYSYEDRMRAVTLYIKLGKRAKATIRQLGYPSKNALKGWCREYEHHLELRLGFAPRAPKFTQAQKKAAVEHYRTHGRCVSATMRALGYPGRATLTAWVREAFPEAQKSKVTFTAVLTLRRAPTPAHYGPAQLFGINQMRRN